MLRRLPENNLAQRPEAAELPLTCRRTANELASCKLRTGSDRMPFQPVWAAAGLKTTSVTWVMASHPEVVFIDVLGDTKS